MALEKLEPILKVLVWPRSALRRMSAAPFGVADVFAGRLAGNAGDASDAPSPAQGAGAGDPFNSAQWKRQYGFKNISGNVDFITFLEDGTVKMGAAGVGTGEGAGGFVLKARATIHNAVMTDHPSFDLPPKLKTMKFQKISGDWSERLPDTRPRASAVYLQTPLPNHSAEVWSGKLERNQAFVLLIEWVGTATQHTTDCGFRITLPGGRYSIVFRQNGQNADAKVELQTRSTDKWSTARRLTEGDPVRFSGRMSVTCAIIAGRWVAAINGQGWHLADLQLPADWKEGMPLEPVGWPAGKLKFTAFGVQPCIQILTGRYLDDDDKPRVGVVQRIVKDIPPRNSYIAGTCVLGYRAEGTELSIDSTGNRDILYTVSLTASPDGLATPLATAAGIQLPAEMEQTEAEPIDLRPYITSWDFTSAEPGVVGASDFNCQLDRTRLARMIPDWEQKIQQFSQVTVELGWRYVDPQFGTLTDGPLEPLLKGYILNPDRDLKDYLGMGMPLVCRDEILRIQEPAGFVDERFSALDILFDKGLFADLYGGDCIKYLLGLQFGPELPGTINGNGNAMAFFPATHFPLLSRTGQGYFEVVKPSSGGSAFRLPPPFGESLQSWFSTIAGYDYAVLYYGRSPLNPTGPPCFIYGRTQEICRAWEAVDGGAPLELPDQVYLAGDSARLLGSASLKFRPEKAYNDFVAWGSGQISESARPYQPGYPATMGRALLPRSDANAPDHSWRRTLLLKQEYLDQQPGLAQNLASRVEAEFEGVDVFTATLVLPRGDETLRWGRKVKPKLPTDPTGKLDGQTLRVMRVAHKGSFSNETAPDQKFTTELTVRPLSGTGM